MLAALSAEERTALRKMLERVLSSVHTASEARV